MTAKDYYQVLGVERTATEKEISKAFKELALKYHPDRNPNNPAAEEKFKDAAEAHTMLGNPQLRKKYDLDCSLLEDLVEPNVQPLISGEWAFRLKDGDRVLINTPGELYLQVGIAKKITFVGEIVSPPGYATNLNFLDARGFRGVVTLPRNIDLKLNLGIYSGKLQGEIAHGGEIIGHNSLINLQIVGNLGIEIISKLYRSRDYHIGGLKLPKENKFVSPYLPPPSRWLRINSSDSTWNVTYRKY